jgi:hypothetical protein
MRQQKKKEVEGEKVLLVSHGTRATQPATLLHCVPCNRLLDGSSPVPGLTKTKSKSNDNDDDDDYDRPGKRDSDAVD